MSRSRAPRRPLTLVAGLALLLLADGNGHAATFVVDSAADVSDAAPGDGVCATNAGSCTLRAAVQETNALAGPDRIELPAGTHVLSGAGGDLDVDDDLELEGAGAGMTTIDADGRDRALHVNGAEVTVRALAVRNGSTREPTGCGGGILSFGGTLRLADVAVTGSRGYRGGGVCNDRGVLEIERATVNGNTADGRSGGGIAVVAFQFGSAAVAILDSTITGNTSAASGGGLSVETFFTSATATIRGTTISDNTAVVFGGGVYGDSGVTAFSIDESTISDNHAQIGGGIATFLLALATSTVHDNTASLDGGGVRRRRQRA
jgi:CSLREA domain-containing protein